MIPYPYPELDFTFIFQVHNREESIQELLTPFLDAQMAGLNCQLIVCNDGSTDRTGEKLQEIMNKSNDYRNTVLTLYDSWEIHLTWRAMQMAEGKICAWLQDDDYYENMDFAIQAKRIFDTHPEIAAMCCKHGYNVSEGMRFLSSYGDYPSTNLSNHKSPNYNAEGYQLVMAVDRPPFMIRRKDYEAIGGLDRNLIVSAYSEPDICLTLGEQGKKVAVYRADGFHFRYWHTTAYKPGCIGPDFHGHNGQLCAKKHQKYLSQFNNRGAS